ncbi:MAG: OsmC family peroxiredoxin [Sphingobacteriales bacterium]|nr:MAG: OsmC family peroxiredoxin [Sphingobacteriales bacterium]
MATAKFGGVAEAHNKGELFATVMEANGHMLVADEPREFGGKNTGPSPGDYLCMSLASCKAITLRMYITRKQWKVDSIHINVKLIRGTELASGMNTFYCEITVPGEVSADQQKRLQEIAKVCPISRMLGKQNEVITSVSGY